MISSQLASSGSSPLKSLFASLSLNEDALSPNAMLRPELSCLEPFSGEVMFAGTSADSCIEINFDSSLRLGIDFNGKSGDEGTEVWVALSSDVRRVGELELLHSILWNEGLRIKYTVVGRFN